MLYRLPAYRPHSSPDPFGATLPPGEGIFVVPTPISKGHANACPLFLFGIQGQDDLEQIAVHHQVESAVLQLHEALSDVQPQAAAIAALARPFCDEITSDIQGNLICHKKGKGKKVMLCAHMDAIGFMVTGADKWGGLSIAPIGGFDPASLINARIVFPNGTRGIIKAKEAAKTLSGGWTSIKMTDLYVDIGASSEKEAMKKVSVGDLAVYEGLPQAVAGHKVMGPYADDLIGCVVLLLAMEQLESSKYDVYFVFSTQEEVGCRGAKTASLAIKPDIAIGVGGYASAPLLWAATRMGVPTLIQEQNGYAGLTNKILGKKTSIRTSDGINDLTEACRRMSEDKTGALIVITHDTPLDDIISAMNGVLTGSYDGLVTDLPVSSYQIKNSFTELQIIEEIPTGEQYGIAISKDNPGLTAAINALD